MAVEFDHLGPGDYDRAKRVLNRARHPGFVGRELYFRCATTGAAIIARDGADDLGVALIVKQKLQALSVVREAQGRGVGAALMAHTAPKWVNAVAEKVPWFEKRGYRSVGGARVGQSGKMATQLMELVGEAPIEAKVAELLPTAPTKPPLPPTVLQPEAPIEAKVAELLGILGIADEETFTPGRVLHAGQARAVASLVTTLVICAARRWGKSVAACFKAYQVARATPGVTCCLIGATQGSISRIFWRTLREMSRDYGLGAVFLKGVEGWTATLSNGSQIVLLPVDSIEAADKVRGLSKVAFVCVDEAQRYKPDVLSYLLLDVIKAMFIDLRTRGDTAQLWLMGTPNPMGKVGTFWDYAQRPGAEVLVGTTYENSKLGPRDQIERVIDEMLAEENQTRDSTWFRREILAEWVVDVGDRVYKLLEANLYDDDAQVPGNLTTYVGIDVGVNDGDAVVVAGHAPADRRLWVVHQDEWSGQGDQVMAGKLATVYEDHGPLRMAIDSGGQGKRALVNLLELMAHLPLVAADKPPVAMQVRAVNDLLAGGMLMVKRGSPLALQLAAARWKDGIVGAKIVEPKHSNLCPALRYLAGACRAYLPDVVDERAPTLDEARASWNAARVTAVTKQEQIPAWVRALRAGGHAVPGDFDDD